MQLKYHMVTIEDLVPAEHFLRKLEAVVDLSFVYIDLDERVPDHSTISQLRRRKPTFRKVFRRLFEEVVRQCVEKGLVSGRLVATDSTHVKANASRASEYLVEVQEEPGAYWERLDRYEEEGLAELERRTGKRRKKRTKQIKRDRRRSHKRVSRTDPEAGHMKRPGKSRGQYYLSHQTTDTDRGIITGVTVTPGDVYDSVPYLEQLEHIHRNVIPVQAATADSAVELKRDAFFYDIEQDAYICPTGKQLRLNTLHRSASGLYWLYQADKRDCQSCPLREKCLSENDRRGARKLEHSYFASERQRHLAHRHDADYKDALKKRQIWCEGTFAAQKWGHNLTRVLRRGLGAAEDHCLLSATALNLKRMIKWLG